MGRLTYRDVGGLACFRWDKPSGNCVISNRAICKLAAFEDVLDRTGLSLDELEALAQAKWESCDTCRQKQDGGSWLFNVYPCRECRNRTKSHYEAAEAALGEGDGE